MNAFMIKIDSYITPENKEKLNYIKKIHAEIFNLCKNISRQNQLTLINEYLIEKEISVDHTYKSTLKLLIEYYNSKIGYSLKDYIDIKNGFINLKCFLMKHEFDCGDKLLEEPIIYYEFISFKGNEMIFIKDSGSLSLSFSSDCLGYSLFINLMLNNIDKLKTPEYAYVYDYYEKQRNSIITNKLGLFNFFFNLEKKEQNNKIKRINIKKLKKSNFNLNNFNFILNNIEKEKEIIMEELFKQYNITLSAIEKEFISNLRELYIKTNY